MVFNVGPAYENLKLRWWIEPGGLKEQVLLKNMESHHILHVLKMCSDSFIRSNMLHVD